MHWKPLLLGYIYIFFEKLEKKNATKQFLITGIGGEKNEIHSRNCLEGYEIGVVDDFKMMIHFYVITIEKESYFKTIPINLTLIS